MSTQTPRKSPPRRALLRSLALASAASLGLAAPVSAADWYLNEDQDHPENWSLASFWSSKADGTGSAATTLYSTDTYHTNGKILRTPASTSLAVFPGGALLLDGGTLRIKSNLNGGVSVPRIIATAGSIDHYFGSAGLQYVQTPVFENRSGATALNADSGRILRFDIGSLIGAGTTRITGGGTGVVLLNVTDAAAYGGDIEAASGSLDFETALSSAGKLVIKSGAKVALDQHVTFTGLVINGAALPVANYPYATLAASYPTYFPAGGSGSITVRAAATWYLSTSQTSGADWTTTPHWRANADGTGATASSVNAFDSYVNQASARVLRTPTGNTTFAGKTLGLSGGAHLSLGQLAGQVSTIPLLNTAGTVTITNGSTGTRGLTLTKWLANAGTTTLSTVSGGVTELRVPELIGAGNLTLSGAGEVRPYVGHTTAHSGTITVNSGAKLAVQAGSPFSTGGKLVVNSGGAVVLGDYLYCTALTVNGVIKPIGTYSVADLGSAFTTANGSKVVVYTADPAGPEQMFGVNMAGADFDTGAIWQDDEEVWDYYQSKGLTQIRLPFRWSTVQSSPNATVNFQNLDNCIRLARERGMKVILDVHSYGSITNGPPRIGHPNHPASWLLNLWHQLSAEYKDEPVVIGYDLMNEPIVNGTGSTAGDIALWADIVQQTVHVIRRNDQKTYIYVEGLNASKANTWLFENQYNATLDIKDPVGRLVYSAHCYWDADTDGVYDAGDVPHADIGKNLARPFVEWLQHRPYAHGHIGEFGVPRTWNQQGWQDALEVFLDYLHENDISATYWAGGGDWGYYELGVHPTTLPGPDTPQMDILEQFPNTLAEPVDVYVDNKLSSTSVSFLPSLASWPSGNTSNSPAYYGSNYQYATHDGGLKTATFTPTIHAAGNYDVFVRWTTGGNRSTTVPYTVVYDGGTATGTLDQTTTKSDAVDGWNPVGTFLFAKGTSGSFTLSNSGIGSGKVVMADAVWFRPSAALPSAWQGTDVGSLSSAGSDSHSGGVYTLTSAGTIYGTADAFRFVHLDATGDCRITARVIDQEDTNTYARAGVMIRDGLAADARFADAILTPGAGGFMQHRPTTGGSVTSSSGGAAAAAYWVRVQRQGNDFKAFKSASGLDGTWEQMGSTRVITMGSTVKIGLVACSFTTNTQSTVTFDNVVVDAP